MEVRDYTFVQVLRAKFTQMWQDEINDAYDELLLLEHLWQEACIRECYYYTTGTNPHQLHAWAWTRRCIYELIRHHRTKSLN